MNTETVERSHVSGTSAVERRVMRDWQITAILPNDMLVETDCNSGEKRTLLKSVCSCGQPVLIEYNAHSCRADKKRIFYPDQDDTGWCAFRCKSCRQPVSETVPGAEYGVPRNAKFSGAKFKPTTRCDLHSIRAVTPCYANNYDTE